MIFYENRIHFEIRNQIQELNDQMEKIITLLQEKHVKNDNVYKIRKITKTTKKNRRVKSK